MEIRSDWGDMFAMNKDASYVNPETYELMREELEKRGMFVFGWMPETRQPAIKIAWTEDPAAVLSGLEEILPHRKKTSKGYKPMAVAGRDDCSLDLAIYDDAVRLRKSVFGRGEDIHTFADLAQAVDFVCTVDHEDMDKPEVLAKFQ